jgi:hypothetical protein
MGTFRVTFEMEVPHRGRRFRSCGRCSEWSKSPAVRRPFCYLLRSTSQRAGPKGLRSPMRVRMGSSSPSTPPAPARRSSRDPHPLASRRVSPGRRLRSSESRHVDRRYHPARGRRRRMDRLRRVRPELGELVVGDLRSPRRRPLRVRTRRRWLPVRLLRCFAEDPQAGETITCEQIDGTLAASCVVLP